jgi:hypothetical protein
LFSPINSIGVIKCWRMNWVIFVVWETWEIYANLHRVRVGAVADVSVVHAASVADNIVYIYAVQRPETRINKNTEPPWKPKISNYI